MKQYNRIMPGEHGMFINDCLANNYIGANFIKDCDLSNINADNEENWRKLLIDKYLDANLDKTIGTARMSIGFLWTICHGLKIGDIVLASNGEGSYHVGEIVSGYQYSRDSNLPHQRKVKWFQKTISRLSMSKDLRNSSGSIGTCCNLTKYSKEIENLINGKTIQASTEIKPERYKEHSLHKLLANYMLNNGILTKTIFHESSKKSDTAKKWIHPDMIGVKFNEFQDRATLSLLKAADTKEYIDLYSFELKRNIDNDHQLKEYFFQALSNSNWANYGYLVALEINEDVLEEMERLNRAFGIGVIHLSPLCDDTKELFQPRENSLDYYTIDKLCRINSDFSDFISRATKVVNAHNDIINDIKAGLIHFCDKGFTSNDEIKKYCDENNIPI